MKSEESKKKMSIAFCSYQAARILGIKDKLLRKYRDEGLISYTKQKGKFWYSKEDITDFLLKSRHEAREDQ